MQDSFEVFFDIRRVQNALDFLYETKGYSNESLVQTLHKYYENA